MKRTMGLAALLVAGAVAASCSAFNDRDRSHVYVTGTAASLVEQGLAEEAPTGDEAAGFKEVPSPGVRFRANVAQATRSPWVDSNGWRFERGVEKANYVGLSTGAAPLAAAEAFAFHVDAILDPDAADVDGLADMLRFLKAQDQPDLPVMANIGIVDDGSPPMGEILNMLTRRNLLYRVVSAPDPALDLTVRLGTPEFPANVATNPYELAQRVRAKLGDDNRLVRLYGTDTTVAHLIGNARHARLYLLAYGGRNRRQPVRLEEGVRVRVRGRYTPDRFAAYGAEPDAQLADVEHPGETTEFTIPAFNTLAIIDLNDMSE